MAVVPNTAPEFPSSHGGSLLRLHSLRSCKVLARGAPHLCTRSQSTATPASVREAFPAHAGLHACRFLKTPSGGDSSPVVGCSRPQLGQRALASLSAQKRVYSYPTSKPNSRKSPIAFPSD